MTIDSCGSLAGGYEVVAGGAITDKGYIKMNGGGNIYASTDSAHFNWNESPKETLVSTGSDQFRGPVLRVRFREPRAG